MCSKYTGFKVLFFFELHTYLPFKLKVKKGSVEPSSSLGNRESAQIRLINNLQGVGLVLALK